ncbi:NAD-dependent epimerase/dehydratase family protein [Pseudahrensia aquimaris]|uniref:NAD-dependent epimerase/dehydratase family protein n=1 Tax=Pseudahrensia aquimaris TaxID=744461 RepID=A0ABW3FEJ7_9HYPH
MAIFPTDRPRRSRLVITGAAGGIGKMIRGKLDHIADEIVLSDLTDVSCSGNERSQTCDLADLDAVRALLKGGGDVLHFGGQSTEAPFERILNANLIGSYNLYEAARLEGVRRVLFASSNHVIGFHPRETLLDADSPMRPDSLYGVSKVYGEGLAHLYHDKFGIESLLLRIGSCFKEPSDRRQLATWMSPQDMIHAIERFVMVPRLGCPVVYGRSNNSENWWDNSKTDYLGWNPQDTAEVFRGKVEAATEVPSPLDPAVKYQGGAFVTADHPGTKEE